MSSDKLKFDVRKGKEALIPYLKEKDRKSILKLKLFPCHA